MSAKNVDIDMSEFRKFFGSLEAAAKGEFRKELELFLESVGTDFLRVLQDEIVRLNVVDGRVLLHSFQRGDDGNVWRIEDGGLTLEVGTNVSYASYVNDGHWTNPAGVARRFVPGYWTAPPGDPKARFVYEPGAKTGMVLKQQWIPGKHYWESALRIMDKIYPKALEERLQKWIDKYFGG